MQPRAADRQMDEETKRQREGQREREIERGTGLRLQVEVGALHANCVKLHISGLSVARKYFMLHFVFLAQAK